MEIFKDNIFKMEYTSVLGGQTSKKRLRNRIKMFIKENRLIAITILTFCVCVSLNFILIWNFFKIIQNMER